MTATCSTCHWFHRSHPQLAHCLEPRNYSVGSVMDPGGNYRFVLDPPSVEPDAVCDFHTKPMRSNYRKQEKSDV